MPAQQPIAGLRIARDTPPMEARLIDQLPEGDGWQFEPKWDGFRCLVFRDGQDVALMSKSGKPLERYFPELAASVLETSEQTFVADGEIVLPIGDTLSFAALQARLHPAASRIARLAEETPAQLILFDCLQLGTDVLLEEALGARRQRLEDFAKGTPASLLLSPCTDRLDRATEWLTRTGGALDGVIAKRRDGPYLPGERAMFKHKVRRTADCVVGGFRTDQSGTGVASLLLGLFDEAGKLHYVGHTSSFSSGQRGNLLEVLAPHRGESAFTGSAPGGPSRWAKPGARTEWVSLAPVLIAEVAYDQVTAGRFRHGTTFVRWRPDKSPDQCTFDQMTAELRPEQLAQILDA